ncbi:hypothetical protein JQ557_26140 [Bradyrhizobium sp. U87765 SZCCT0131]|uniref:acyltransferase domain-containing protein n=1 Tax=Bradyrhizobium sp. U87765 SZCCT0109 TaxID=2807656 RepID=UPI001BA59399|nr:hypothetical protein [Bradyrhizobium sp. U87765 SZCCT0131]MBR1264571.1 hypothetical protein [Bradyrhizobium sp. U87765 SZCCT0134]MBR1304523.1 hypothetical protein [Bradyrhizobium sp. U87765 SZCCT0110]MBR1322620.1 hypothetical protein [Bradyrhizobium sp. U87765 SZCCT0109]MBR1346452.1 hypothetical protein [Bradyrhizobium sp. U87765 SZCCT0048]
MHRRLLSDQFVDHSVGILVCNGESITVPLENTGELLQHLSVGAIKRRRMAHQNRLAAVNYANHFVVAGEEDGMRRMETALKNRHVVYQRLPVRFGFHSPAIDAAAAPFQAYCATQLMLRQPSIPMLSSVTAEQVSTITTSHFWHAMRGMVRFSDALDAMMQHVTDEIFIDCGPSGTLATFLKYAGRAGQRKLQCPDGIASAEPILRAPPQRHQRARPRRCRDSCRCHGRLAVLLHEKRRQFSVASGPRKLLSVSGTLPLSQFLHPLHQGEGRRIQHVPHSIRQPDSGRAGSCRTNRRRWRKAISR